MSLDPDTPSSIFNDNSEYDVFINFRGKDTRKNFTSFLYKALRENNIKAFIDAKSLRKGEEISSALLKAIKRSKISLVIFSENYASSKWCLEELVYILKCRERKGHIVLPIFYRVDSSDVRDQEGTFETAFLAHQRSLKYTREKLLEWKGALTTTSNLSGWDSRDWDEPKLIKKIVKNVLSTLNFIRSRTTEDLESLIGIEMRLKEIESALCLGSLDVRIIGLWGMGGIGKSTIARFVFHRLSSQFEGCCYLENVREESKKHGLDYLESKLFSELLEEEDMINVVNNFVKNRIRKQKVLIVLDDVDCTQQLERLVRGRTWFGPGSRIIITSRDKQVLRCCADLIYEVKALSAVAAFQLFLKNASGGESSLREGYLHLSKSIVNNCMGHPLVLKVLGSFLRAGTKGKWESTLHRLKTASNSTSLDPLRLCFDGLDDAEKEILFHIAFLKGKDKDLIERKLEESGNLFASKGIQALVEKSFISIKDGGKVWMHDLVQYLTWEIVRLESTSETENYSRSLFMRAIHHFWRTNKENCTYGGRYVDVNSIVYEELEPTLKMLGKRYNHPPEYLSSMNNPHKLVGVDMPGSQLRQFWNAIPDESSHIGLYISCEGQWRKGRDCWTFVSTKTKRMKVSKDITHQELVERICSRLRVDPSQYDLDMRYRPNSVGPLAPIVIENDEDVHFFISESSCKDSVCPLCITFIRKGQHESSRVLGWVWRATDQWLAGSWMRKFLNFQ